MSLHHHDTVCTKAQQIVVSTGAATPLRDNAWSGGRTPMHPSMEDGDDAHPDNYGSSSQRAGPTGHGASYPGMPYREESRQVSIDT